MDGFGKVVPADDSLVAEVVDARDDALVDGCHDGGCQIAGVGGGAYLVEDYAKTVFGLSQFNHCLDKIVAKGGVEPGGADNHRAVATGHACLFAGELGASIHAVWASRVGLGIWRMLGSVEYVVGGNLYQETLAALDGLCQIGRSLGIEKSTKFLVALCAVNSGVGCTVDDSVYLMFVDKCTDGLGIRGRLHRC